MRSKEGQCGSAAPVARPVAGRHFLPARIDRQGSWPITSLWPPSYPFPNAPQASRSHRCLGFNRVPFLGEAGRRLPRHPRAS